VVEPELPSPRAGVAPVRRAAKRPRTETGDGASLRIDTELRRLDQLAGVGRLAAETAHEVRNALTAVRTLVQLLPTRGDDPELRGPFLALASEELERTERLLDALLAQAHGAPCDAAPDSDQRCVPGDAMQGVAQIVARRAAQQGVQITVDLEPELPAAAISGDALRQALLNLTLNALAASPAGGDVRLAARRLDLGEPGAAAIELTVEDRGPGVPPALRRRVFDPWFSSDSGRAGGLGLAIVRDLLATAHGSIDIEDRPGGGARMRVRIPSAPSETRLDGDDR
jgi:signal transduction histidine kinase